MVVLPDGMDPCDYRMKYGSEALRDYVTSKSNQVPIVEHVLNIIAQEYDLEDPAASVRYAGTEDHRLLCVEGADD